MTSTEITDQIDRAGLMPWFTRRQKELRDQGESPMKAFEHAAETCLEAIDRGTSPDQILNPVADESILRGRESTKQQDYEWVYQNLGLQEPDITACPSSGAWGLLQYAQEDRKGFFAEYNKMLARLQDGIKESEEDQETEMQLDELDRMLAALAERSENDAREPEVPPGNLAVESEESPTPAGVV